MDIKTFITNWISAGNQYNTQKYLDFYLPDAILDDPSVGRKFNGHDGILEYFESYFIGYQTQTKFVKLIIEGDNHAHLEVIFSGAFPEGKLGGTFDFTFERNKIKFVRADLLH
jgi:hypothetical protein